jgi:hypothetical protein
MDLELEIFMRQQREEIRREKQRDVALKAVEDLKARGYEDSKNIAIILEYLIKRA